MRIVICDDEELYRRRIGEIISEYFDERAEVEIILIEDGADVLELSEEPDVLLLDIDMPGMDGIKVKNLLYKRKAETKILFITNHEERMREAFGMQVMGFVEKGRLSEELPVYLKEIEETVFFYRWIGGEDGERYSSRTVCYIKAAGDNCVNLYLRDGKEVLLRNTLNRLENDLKEVGFIRIHREYLVNMQEIIEITGKAIITGEKSLPISVRRKSMVKKEYEEFLRKHMRYQ